MASAEASNEEVVCSAATERTNGRGRAPNQRDVVGTLRLSHQKPAGHLQPNAVPNTQGLRHTVSARRGAWKSMLPVAT